ncbi:YkgB family protein [Chryseobacterium herbae]|uniref:YkgB family protein n=1 Tax=Chryseobacterium herbae TaxID=2976476 RepID=A0ABT2IY21_9FLAO|nr:YkgB family protein [Chryseobacterium sp. pc1-10]MCT2563396.1 YkgB family protein [Chryseobacterium sp. pc1-10]
MRTNTLYTRLLRLDSYFLNFLRISIFIVMAWIGGLKAFQYEADGIVPFVANSPFMSFFYKNAGHKVLNEDQKLVSEYTLYKNPEGKTVKKNINWHTKNGTYIFSYGLGTMIVIIAILVLLGIWYPKIGALSGALTFIMSFVTLSFLVTTPEVYVPDLGGDFPTPQFGFPYLSGAGRLVVKDIIMMAAGLVLFSDSLKKVLKDSGMTTATQN